MRGRGPCLSMCVIYRQTVAYIYSQAWLLLDIWPHRSGENRAEYVGALMSGQLFNDSTGTSTHRPLWPGWASNRDGMREITVHCSDFLYFSFFSSIALLWLQCMCSTGPGPGLLWCTVVWIFGVYYTRHNRSFTRPTDLPCARDIMPVPYCVLYEPHTSSEQS